MKYLIILMMLIGFSMPVDAHCGSCSVGSNKKEHKHMTRSGKHEKYAKKTVERLGLNRKQKKTFNKLMDDYQVQVQKLQNDFRNELEKVLDKKQFRQFIKSEEKLFYVPTED